MSSLSPTPQLHLEVQPGKPPILTVEQPENPQEWAHQHRYPLREAVTARGALLIRGLGLTNPEQAGALFTRLGGPLMANREAFAPRRPFARGVYSSSKWPASRPMSMHHELSYAYEIPTLMLFACISAPRSGGATAISDSPTMLDTLPGAVVARFLKQGWLLTRNYNDDIGSSIADSFGTNDRCYVEAYCRANAIEFAWQPGGGLRTRQRRAAVVRHPHCWVRCWFNQVAFLNQWTLEPEVREYLIETYGPDGLPFNTAYGDGEPIEPDVIDLIVRTYDAHTLREPWQPGDLMLIDNIRTAHSRDPFTGHREILVAMTDPTTATALN
jgi:alpha-ketoglutarate-dependent taurine dioxygenase